MSKIYLVFKYISFVIGSYLLVHILGIFGIFIAVAYPIWWLISIKKVPCFFCRTKNDGEICPVCKTTVKKDERFPKTVKSVILNTSLIFVMFLFSLGTVSLEARVLRSFGYYQIDKTVSFAFPTKGQYRLGEIFPMDITLANVKTPINTVQADLSFDPDILEIEDISTEKSFAKVIVQKEIQNDTGFARVSGGLPNPGITCEDCHFASVIFRTKKPGTALVKYLPSSMVLANDGKGSNIIKTLGSTAFIVLPEKVDDDQARTQEVYLQTKVLGISSGEGENQIHLYKGRVLSETDTNIPETPVKLKFDVKTWPQKVFTSIESLDSFIINFWKKIIEI